MPSDGSNYVADVISSIRSIGMFLLIKKKKFICLQYTVNGFLLFDVAMHENAQLFNI